MASSSLPFSPLILGIFISIFVSLISPSNSAVTCATQTLKATYANCTDLPSLGATLHSTYNTTNHSLSIAFAAEPAKSDGWVSWGINPTGGGMVGSQALIAYKLNGKVAVFTYNLTSYKGIEQVKTLSLETWDLSAEDANGVITIFAVVKLPEKADNFSQVWQVGPVSAGKPMVHEFKPENLQAKMSLLATAVTTGNTTTPSGGGGSGGGNTTSSGEKSGGVSVMVERFGLVFYLGLGLVYLSLM